MSTKSVKNNTWAWLTLLFGILFIIATILVFVEGAYNETLSHRIQNLQIENDTVHQQAQELLNKNIQLQQDDMNYCASLLDLQMQKTNATINALEHNLSTCQGDLLGTENHVRLTADTAAYWLAAFFCNKEFNDGLVINDDTRMKRAIECTKRVSSGALSDVPFYLSSENAAAYREKNADVNKWVSS